MLSALLRITYILLLVLGIAGLFWFAPPDTPTAICLLDGCRHRSRRSAKRIGLNGSEL